jgi:hypothetical protein
MRNAHNARASLLVRTDNEVLNYKGGLVIRTVLSVHVQVGLVIRKYEKTSLSVQIIMYG